MSNNQDFDEIIKEARQEIHIIIICLLDKNVDTDTILSVLAINRSEIEELKRARNDKATKIAINLAKEAKRLNITTEEIERVTGIDTINLLKT